MRKKLRSYSKLVTCTRIWAPSSGAEVKIEWSYTSMCPYALFTKQLYIYSYLGSARFKYNQGCWQSWQGFVVFLSSSKWMLGPNGYICSTMPCITSEVCITAEVNKRSLSKRSRKSLGRLSRGWGQFVLLLVRVASRVCTSAGWEFWYVVCCSWSYRMTQGTNIVAVISCSRYQENCNLLSDLLEVCSYVTTEPKNVSLGYL